MARVLVVAIVVFESLQFGACARVVSDASDVEMSERRGNDSDAGKPPRPRASGGRLAKAKGRSPASEAPARAPPKSSQSQPRAASKEEGAPDVSARSESPATGADKPRESRRSLFAPATAGSLRRYGGNMLPSFVSNTTQGIIKSGHIKDVTGEWGEEMTKLMKATHLARTTVDRTKKKDYLPTGYQVDRVLELTSPTLEKEYNEYKAGVLEDITRLGLAEHNCKAENKPVARSSLLPGLRRTLDENPCLNEVYLFHGTSLEASKAIGQTGYDMERAGKNVGSMLGPGVYLTDASTKADEYTHEEVEEGRGQPERRILLFKVILGRVLLVDPAMPKYREQLRYLQKNGQPVLRNMLARRGKHSLLRDGENKKPKPTFKEYVLFHGEAILPKFIIEYTRLGGNEKS